MSAQDSGDKMTLSRDEKQSDTIMPSEIQMLPKLQFYLKLPEHNPALIQLNFAEINNIKSSTAAFIMRPGMGMADVLERQSEIQDQADLWLSKTTKTELEKNPEKQQQEPPVGGKLDYIIDNEL